MFCFLGIACLSSLSFSAILSYFNSAFFFKKKFLCLVFYLFVSFFFYSNLIFQYFLTLVDLSAFELLWFGFLGAFAKLRKAPISFVMSVCPHATTRLPLDGFLLKLHI